MLSKHDVIVCFVCPGQFEKGVAEGAVDPVFNPIVALRLSVRRDSAVWAIVSEVSTNTLFSL
jgi:hypothetical protein